MLKNERLLSLNLVSIEPRMSCVKLICGDFNEVVMHKAPATVGPTSARRSHADLRSENRRPRAGNPECLF